MNVFSYPLRYLNLKTEKGGNLIARDLIGILILSFLLSIPFWFTDSNYFGTGGFLDRFGSFSGVLTGFYVAALVGVASFATPRLGIDNVIVVGPVLDHSVTPPKRLTRREYVCSLFGFLAFAALVLSIVALLLTVVAGPVSLKFAVFLPLGVLQLASGFLLFLINLGIACVVATTCHGLYYLIDKLYTPKTVTLDREGNPLP